MGDKNSSENSHFGSNWKRDMLSEESVYDL